MLTTKPNVSTPSAEAEQMAPWLELIADIRGGLPAMRKRAAIYLPRYQNESADDYKRRVATAPWRPEWTDALRTLSSKPFSKPVNLGDAPPAPIVAFCNDVDGCGNNLHTFARRFFESAVADGLGLLLVDHPPVGEGIRTLADYKAAGHRPFWALYQADSIIGLRMARIGGRKRIVDLRLRERVIVPDGFGEQAIEQVRHLTPGHYEIWRENSKGEWVIVEQDEVSHADGSPMLGVDAVILRTGDALGDLATRPPLLDLANMQVELWKALSNLAEVLEFSASPMLVAKNAGILDGGGDVKVGPRAVLQCGENGDWKFISPAADNIAEIKGHVRDVIADMARLAMQPAIIRPGVTATEVSLQASKAHSALEAWALGLQDAIEQALVLTAAHMTDDERKAIGKWAPNVDVHSDFASEIGKNEEAQVIVSAAKSGVISLDGARAELLRRQIIEPAQEAEQGPAPLDGCAAARVG